MKKKLFLIVTFISFGVIALVGSIFLFSQHLNHTVHVDLGETKQFLTAINEVNNSSLHLEKAITQLFAIQRRVEAESAFEKIKETKANAKKAIENLHSSKWDSIKKVTIEVDSNTTTVDELLKAVIQRFDPLLLSVTNIAQSRVEQIKDLEDLDANRKELSKIYRESESILKLSGEPAQKLSRAVLTVLSSSSLKDIAYAGRAIFRDVQQHFGKAKLNKQQAEAWASLEKSFLETRTTATEAFAASGDFPILIGEFNQLRSQIASLNQASNQTFDSSSVSLSELTVKLRYLNLSMGIVLFACCFWAFLVVVQVVKRTSSSTSDLLTLKSQINSSASTTSQFGQRLKEASDQQANAVNSSLSSIEEMASSLEQTSKNAMGAAQTGKRAQSIARGSEGAMRDLEQTMVDLGEKAQMLEGILQSFRMVEDKVGLINEIVMKTQILSFNASIEAERAGEYGRGFSVVAEEVGTLSRTSGLAAEEINKILKSTKTSVSETVDQLRGQVELGQKATRSSISAFSDIQKSIQELELQISQIAANAEAQFRTVEEFRNGFESTQQLAVSNQTLANDLQRSSQTLESGAIELELTLGELSKVVHGKTITGPTKIEDSAA